MGARRPRRWAISTPTTTGLLLVDAETPLPCSHRHLSNLIGLYPFNLITCEGGAQDAQRIQRLAGAVGQARHQRTGAATASRG